MKYFEIHHNDNVVHASTKRSFSEFNQWLWNVAICTDEEKKEIKIFVNKKEVNWDEAKEVVDDMADERERKLEETHKKVWVKFQGVTNFKSNYKQIWVKK